MSTLCYNFYWLQQGLRSEIVIAFISWLWCCISICLWLFPFFHICPGHAVVHQVWNMGQLWHLIFITVTNWFTPVKTPIYYCEKLTFLKLVERVSWSKKTQCGQQESPPDLQLSAQVLSWIDFKLEVNCQYFLILELEIKATRLIVR